MEVYYDESLAVKAHGTEGEEYTVVKHLTDIKLKVDGKEIDVTFLEDSGYQSTFKTGFAASIEANGYLSNSDAGQKIINDTQFERLDGAIVDFKYTLTSGAYVTGSATVSGLENTGGTDMVPLKFTLKVNGKPNLVKEDAGTGEETA